MPTYEVYMRVKGEDGNSARDEIKARNLKSAIAKSVDYAKDLFGTEAVCVSVAEIEGSKPETESPAS